MFKIPRVIISWSSSYQIQEEGIRGGGCGGKAEGKQRERGVSAWKSSELSKEFTICSRQHLMRVL